MIVFGDARTVDNLPRKYFKTAVTSPPYWGQRLYGESDLEIGIESLEEYLDDTRQCARSWRDIMTDDAVLWYNIADTAAGSGGAGGDYNKGGSKAGRPRYRQGDPGRAKMQWCNIPHRVAEIFVEEGWLYRHCIIWEKTHASGKPILRRANLNHERRPGTSHEFIFMFSMSRQYTWHTEALAERGSVWHFAPERNSDHQAPFPEELPRRCIALTSDPGDAVIDPFGGSMTTVRVAEQMGREGWGLELYEELATGNGIL